MKNKYFYQIYKLKIKPWIKYWLIKAGEIKGVLSEILTGTSFYLEDSIRRKFKMFEIYGRTTQEGDPTPENPIPIKNTGDNGSVNVKVENKNLFNQEEFEANLVTGKIKNDNGNEVTDSVSTYSTYMIPFKANVPIYVYGWFQRVYFLDSNKNWVRRSPAASEVRNSVYNLDYDGFMQFQIQNTIYNSNKGLEQVEYNSTATSYVPHAEQNISFPLAQGQKFMQGDYLADDGVHHVRGEVVLDGSDDETYGEASEGNTTDGFSIYSFGNFIPNIKSGTSKILLCDYFKFIPRASVSSTSLNFCAAGAGKAIVLNIDRNLLSEASVAGFKSYLQENPITVQYELAEEVIDTYTEEQQTVYNQIKELYTYSEQTNILSPDETPPELKIQYWKEA